jgi:hypothetical protein
VNQRWGRVITEPSSSRNGIGTSSNPRAEGGPAMAGPRAPRLPLAFPSAPPENAFRSLHAHPCWTGPTGPRPPERWPAAPHGETWMPRSSSAAPPSAAPLSLVLGLVLAPVFALFPGAARPWRPRPTSARSATTWRWTGACSASPSARTCRWIVPTRPCAASYSPSTASPPTPPPTTGTWWRQPSGSRGRWTRPSSSAPS